MVLISLRYCLRSVIRMALACTLGLALCDSAWVYAQTNPIVDPAFDSAPRDLTTVNGKVYALARLQRLEPDGLVIEYAPSPGAIGVAKIRFEMLPEELQKEYGYDPDIALEYRRAQARGTQEMRVRMLAQEKRANAIKQERENENSKALAQRASLQRSSHSIPSQRANLRNEESVSDGVLYNSTASGHWVKKNIDRGAFILLDDGSLWKIDPVDKIDAMLWLALDSITVVESGRGSLGYDHLLINTDDGEKAHGKYMGKQ